MIGMSVKLDGEGAWPDLPSRKVVHLSNDAPPIQVGVLDKGMISGRPSVAFRIDLPDGSTVIAETTARLFVMAASTILARYPDLLKDDG